MKNNYISKFVLVLTVFAVAFVNLHCTNNDAMPEETTVTFLVDVTDTTLLAATELDFHQNLPVFFQRSNLHTLQAGQKLTVKMSPIGASGVFSLKQAEVFIPTNVNYLSKREAEKVKDPAPILELISTQLDEYKKLAAEGHQSSPILDVLLKSFCEMSPTSAREMVVVFTDGYEYSRTLNMYRIKSIPTSETEIADILNNTDQILLQDAREKLKSIHPEVIFVLKETAGNKINQGDLKLYYTELLRQIGITEKIVFIDNLTNTPIR